MKEKQLAKLICQYARSIMKNTLNLEEFSYREEGRNDPRYRTFKKHLMEFTYNSLRDLFQDLHDWGLILPTEEIENVKDGYRDSPSGGSGYVNSNKLNKLLKSSSKD